MKEKKEIEMLNCFDWECMKEIPVVSWVPLAATLGTCGVLAISGAVTPGSSGLAAGALITSAVDVLLSFIVAFADDDFTVMPPLSTLVAMGALDAGVGVRNLACKGINKFRNKFHSKKHFKADTIAPVKSDVVELENCLENNR